MTVRPRRILVLGPRGRGGPAGRAPGVAADLVAPDGPVALITAGWQEREAEDGELRGALPVPSTNLRLYRRAEEAAREDPHLAAAHGRLQERLKLLRRAYNLRLGSLMEAWIALLSLDGDPSVLEPEREAALAAVRALDEGHVRRVAELRREFVERHRPAERRAVARHRGELARVVGDSAAVVVAGGHVAVLLNRMRLFGMPELLNGRSVVAWSAGAMALSRRVVLFHDSPPWGPGHAEAFDQGLDVLPELVPLPHASRRLRLDDPGRVGRFARRFGPDACVALDPGARLEWEGGWRASPGTRRLGVAGGLQEMGA